MSGHGGDTDSSEVVVNRDGRVVMESRAQLVARMRREIDESWQGGSQTSAADELIAERRAEAAAEDASS
ncbi:hypothetical protein AD006_16265 [Pseudonocardia sp. EC080610-09]|nr:hypothetical protein AD006_16265 [Pseudonocardia sp. EC080610-09]ALL84999.1 hypothetical protein AD017_24100 [Pseudonocardia sp. EC080619-01]